MRLTVWGARGSIAVSGASFVRYGGDTTCIQVDTDEGEIIILDLGTGVRALGNALLRQLGTPMVCHILLTHAHWDHLQGFPFFGPLYLPDVRLNFHGWPEAQRSVRTLLQQTMKPPFFPVDLHQVAADLVFGPGTNHHLSIGNLQIDRFPLCHPNGGCGFRLTEDGRSAVFFPDNEFTYPHEGGKSFEEYVRFCKGAKLLIHDAMYLPGQYKSKTRGWGHSIYSDAVRLGLEAECERLLLWHHDPERTDDEMDDIVSSARKLVSEADSSMSCDAAYTGMVIDI